MKFNFIQIKKLLVVSLSVFINLYLVPFANGETSLERIQRTGEIRIGYANEAPFAYTLSNGTITGESPEIAKIIFKKMGVKKVKAILTEWGGLIPGLKAGRFDMIAAGMYVTPERLQQVLFTDPHYQIQDGLLVAQGNPHQLNSYASIAKNPNITLAIMTGTAEYSYAREAGIPEHQIMQVPNPIAQLRAVRTGRAQAAVGTALTIKNLAKKGGKKVAVITHFEDSPEHTGYGALAFRKTDQNLRDAVNTVLKTWLGSEEHIKVVSQFGFDETNLTKKTIEEIAH